MVKNIITYGTFDLFHIGHVRLLKRLRALGDALFVGCATDEFNTIKGKRAIYPYSHRVEILKSCRYVDHVSPEVSWDQKQRDIVEKNISLFGMGSDWEGKFNELEESCEVVYLPRTNDISTLDAIKMVQDRAFGAETSEASVHQMEISFC